MIEEKKPELMSTKEVAFMTTQIGFSIAITATLFVGGGRWLDNYTGKFPLFTLLGIVLGLAASLYFVYQIVRPLMRKYKTDFSVLKKPTDQNQK
ncbi:AtpZ/AtpI family protein [Candidatus Peregrinibacteria bacterium]|nr:AtpZ/AtpI family protein [Candidatus Peregrinibacteria bacterium]